MTLSPEMIEAGIAALRESGVLAQQRYEQGIVSEVYTAMHRAAPAGITDEAVERVARALFDHEWSHTAAGARDEVWAAQHEREYWFEAAKAAIAALTVLLPLIDQEDQGVTLTGRAAAADAVEPVPVSSKADIPNAEPGA
jgi:hypothetical protein